jgi:hypothetical protein
MIEYIDDLVKLKNQIEEHKPKVLISYGEAHTPDAFNDDEEEVCVFQYLDNDLNKEILTKEELENYGQESTKGHTKYDNKKGVTKGENYYSLSEGYIPLSALQTELNNFLLSGGDNWKEFVELFFKNINSLYDFYEIDGLKLNDFFIADSFDKKANKIGWNYSPTNYIFTLSIDLEISDEFMLDGGNITKLNPRVFD